MPGKFTNIYHIGAGSAVTSLSLGFVVYFWLFSALHPVMGDVMWSGDIEPADPTTWTTGTSVSIGRDTDGTVSLTNGGEIGIYRTYIAYNSGTTGKLTVDGPETKWNNNNDITIGRSGDGILNLTGGAVISNARAFIGDNSGSTGAVIVDGPGSTWTSTYNNTSYFYGALNVGFEGNGTLNVTGGGAVNVIGTTYIGYDYGTTGVIKVDGINSSLTNLDGPFMVGFHGNATVNVTSGGSLNTAITAMASYFSSTCEATVDGAGSTWTINDDFFIGSYGSVILNITNGGTVTVLADTFLSSYYPDRGTIKLGSGGTLRTCGLLFESNDLTGTGTINTNGLVGDLDLVFDATHASNQTLNISDNPNQNITINLDANGSGSMGAGYSGDGTMTISNGRFVASKNGYIGYKIDSTGAVTVDGPCSTWNSGGDWLYVGDKGKGTLHITNGGGVIDNSAYIANATGSIGEAMVDGPGSTWTNNINLYVGFRGHGTLHIINGGTVNSAAGMIGTQTDSAGEATVNGAGSTWTNTDNFYIGALGNGVLNVIDGATVTSGSSQIAHTSGATGVVSIDGPESTWSNTDKLSIGEKGNGSLKVTNGSTARNDGQGYIGENVGSTGQVVVDGTGSTWINSNSLDNLYVGYDGGGTLNITNGGLVSVAGTLIIDHDEDGDGFINMSTGGMLALHSKADDSLAAFLELVHGTDAIRYWDYSISDWANILGATRGRDYLLEYLNEGELAGYTVLKVMNVPEPSMATLLIMGAAGILAYPRRKRKWLLSLATNT